MTKTIGFLALDGVQSLDLTGPMEVFALAGAMAGQPYALVLLSESGAAIRCHAGYQIGPARALSAAPEALDTLIVAGGSREEMLAAMARGVVLPWIVARAPRLRRLVSICTGAFVLAAAGLLNGRRATSHWRVCAEMARLFPHIQVEPDAIFVADGPVYTSAGVTAGIDLCLALVEADLGAEIALEVARELVLFLRRPGGQSQFSTALRLDAQTEPRLKAIVRAILDDPAQGDLRVPALAARAGMSERSFARHFQRSLGMPPAQFVELARVERAKSLLERSDLALDRLAERAGFGSADALFRSFQRHLGVTPTAYRERFSLWR